MKKVLAVLLMVTFMLPAISFAAEDVEKLKAEYKGVVNEFGQNGETQRLLIEGFKQTNATYQALIDRQLKLQEMAKSLAEKIQKLEAPVPAEVPEGGGTAETD